MKGYKYNSGLDKTFTEKEDGKYLSDHLGDGFERYPKR